MPYKCLWFLQFFCLNVLDKENQSKNKENQIKTKSSSGNIKKVSKLVWPKEKT